MQNVFSIKGLSAELKWSYHLVASLGAWSVSGAHGAFTFTASIVASDLTQDDFRLSQRLEVVTPNGWRWIVEPDTLQIAGATLTALIRTQQEPTHAALSDCHP